jgi:hypothetical protein
MILEADTILPVQLPRGATDAEPAPEKMLMIAIYEEALDKARKKRDSAERQEAREWIMNDDLTWFYSFIPMCHVLGLNPQAIRSQLLRANWEINGTLRASSRTSRRSISVRRTHHTSKERRKPRTAFNSRFCGDDVPVIAAMAD